MRIISPLRDYYDCVQVGYASDDVVYLRHPFEEEFPVGLYSDFNNDFSVQECVVGFCGKTYIGLTVNCGLKKQTVYSIEGLEKFLALHLHPKAWRQYQSTGTLIPGWRAKNYKLEFQRVFGGIERWSKQKKPYASYILKELYPVCVLHNRVVEYNCLLKPYEFYRVFPPQQAFQEIQQYLANLAVPRKPIPEISDEIMAEIKGFDKFSFRKPKQKSNRRKKQ